jgi:hypothetical protein
MNEKVTTVLGIEFDTHELTILDKLPEGVYVKALIVEWSCEPRAAIIRINDYTLIDECGEDIADESGEVSP